MDRRQLVSTGAAALLALGGASPANGIQEIPASVEMTPAERFAAEHGNEFERPDGVSIWGENGLWHWLDFDSAQLTAVYRDGAWHQLAEE